MGELFQYVIGTPVTVGRGQSAMVPILSSKLAYRKDLLYNGTKMPDHPIATLRLDNDTGLTLERGPVTVLENSEYVGEAVLPFTVAESELIIPYAVELGVKISEHADSRVEIHSIHLKNAYLHIEQWDIRWREYQLNNSTGKDIAVRVEHPRTSQYERFDTPEPVEQTDEHLRFEVQVPKQGEAKLKVQERQLIRRQVELQRMTHTGLKKHLSQGLIDQAVYDQVADLLKLWEEIADHEKALEEIEKERQKIYKAQEQIQKNMRALGKEGKEGEMRADYVEKLAATEQQLQELAQRETALQNQIEQLKATCDERIQALNS